MIELIDIDKLQLSDYVLKIRRNLFSLSTIIIFLKYSGAVIDCNIRLPIFGISISNVNIVYFKKSVLAYLIYILFIYLSYLITHFITLFVEIRKNYARAIDKAMASDPCVQEEEEYFKNEYPFDIINKETQRMEKLKYFKIVILFIEFFAPIISSIWAIVVFCKLV